MACQRNVRPSATTPLLTHPLTSYRSLLVDVGCCTSPSVSDECGSWLNEEDATRLLTQLPLPYVQMQRERVVDEKEVELLRDQFDRLRPDERLAVVRRRAAEYVALFHQALSAVEAGRVQCQLVAILHWLVEADDFIRQTCASTVGRPDHDLVLLLLRLLQSAMDRPKEYRELPPHFLPAALCHLITTLLRASLPSVCFGAPGCWRSEAVSKQFISWLLHQPLKLPPTDSSVSLLAAAFRSLRELVRFPALLTFFHQQEGLLRVSPFLRPSIAAEPYVYNLGFLLWLSSLSAAGWEHCVSLDLLPHLLGLLFSSRNEKCIRLYLRLVDRLAQQSSQTVLEYVLEAGLPAHLRSLSARQWRDADVVELVASMQRRLAAAECELSSWPLYRSELLSASLHLSPPHLSLAFFHSHLDRFAARHAAVVRRLLSLLEDRRVSGVARATAAWDLGQLAACGEAGKRLLLHEVNGVKEGLLRVMGMEQEADADVRRAAVVALQKMMVPRWQEFEKQCSLEAVHLAVRPPLRLPERPVAITDTVI